MRIPLAMAVLLVASVASALSPAWTNENHLAVDGLFATELIAMCNERCEMTLSYYDVSYYDGYDVEIRTSTWSYVNGCGNVATAAWSYTYITNWHEVQPPEGSDWFSQVPPDLSWFSRREARPRYVVPPLSVVEQFLVSSSNVPDQSCLSSQRVVSVVGGQVKTNWLVITNWTRPRFAVTVTNRVVQPDVASFLGTNWITNLPPSVALLSAVDEKIGLLLQHFAATNYMASGDLDQHYASVLVVETNWDYTLDWETLQIHWSPVYTTRHYSVDVPRWSTTNLFPLLGVGTAVVREAVSQYPITNYYVIPSWQEGDYDVPFDLAYVRRTNIYYPTTTWSAAWFDRVPPTTMSWTLAEAHWVPSVLTVTITNDSKHHGLSGEYVHDGKGRWANGGQVIRTAQDQTFMLNPYQEELEGFEGFSFWRYVYGQVAPSEAVRPDFGSWVGDVGTGSCYVVASTADASRSVLFVQRSDRASGGHVSFVDDSGLIVDYAETPAIIARLEDTNQPVPAVSVTLRGLRTVGTNQYTFPGTFPYVVATTSAQEVVELSGASTPCSVMWHTITQLLVEAVDLTTNLSSLVVSYTNVQRAFGSPMHWATKSAVLDRARVLDAMLWACPMQSYGRDVIHSNQFLTGWCELWNPIAEPVWADLTGWNMLAPCVPERSLSNATLDSLHFRFRSVRAWYETDLEGPSCPSVPDIVVRDFNQHESVATRTIWAGWATTNDDRKMRTQLYYVAGDVVQAEPCSYTRDAVLRFPELSEFPFSRRWEGVAQADDMPIYPTYFWASRKFKLVESGEWLPQGRDKFNLSISPTNSPQSYEAASTWSEFLAKYWVKPTPPPYDCNPLGNVYYAIREVSLVDTRQPVILMRPDPDYVHTLRRIVQ